MPKPDNHFDTQHQAEIDLNLRNHVFFHAANNVSDLHSIRLQGFRSDWIDEEGRWFRDGNLGIGTYLTCNWKTAILFGTVLLQVELERGTRIVDTSRSADPTVLLYLKAKFGHEILSATDVKKVLPDNKRLTQNELIELSRYHYTKLWERDWGCDVTGFQRWPQKRIRHAEALASCVSLLKRYGFHGYGNPNDDNGIVIFSSDRVRVAGVLAKIPFEQYCKIGFELSLEGVQLEDLMRQYPPRLEIDDDDFS